MGCVNRSQGQHLGTGDAAGRMPAGEEEGLPGLILRAGRRVAGDFPWMGFGILSDMS